MDTKGDISRDNLLRHGIFFEPVVYEIHYVSTQPGKFIIPNHVDAIREGLLVMENIVPRGWENHLRNEFAQFGTPGIGPVQSHHPQSSAFLSEKQYELDLQQRSKEWETANETFKRWEKVAERARKLCEDPEAEWNFFWRSEIFMLFSEEARMQAGFKQVYFLFPGPVLDSWSLHESVLWNEVENWVKPHPLLKSRTQPKPDLTYAFPIRNLLSDSQKGFARDELSQAFSLQILGNLTRKGISCTPTTGLRRWISTTAKTNLSSADRTCFPWAVVEMKRQATTLDASIEKCYCQAANAAAAALDMQRQLFSEFNDNTWSQPPPVIAFTCIGSDVKVWLMYEDKQGQFGKQMKRMVCIWSTSVLLTWGVASLRAIILNMNMWASRLLKPKLQVRVYNASQNLQAGSKGSLWASSSRRPPLSLSKSPRISTPERKPSPMSRSDQVSSPTYLPSAPRTLKRQEASVPTPRQPRANTPNDSQLPSDNAQANASKLAGSQVGTIDWATVLSADARSNKFQSHSSSSTQSSPLSNFTNKETPNLFAMFPSASPRYTPTRSSKNSSQYISRNRSNATTNSSSSIAEGVDNTKTTKIKGEAHQATKAEQQDTVFDLTRALESSSIEDVSQSLISPPKEVSNSQDNAAIKFDFGAKNTNTGRSSFSSSSTTRTPGIFGRATSGALGQNSIFGRVSSKSNTNTAKGPDVQNLLASAESSRGVNAEITRGLRKYPNGLGMTKSSSGAGLFGTSKPTSYDFGTSNNITEGGLIEIPDTANDDVLRRSNTDQSERSRDDSGSLYEPSGTGSDSDNEPCSVVATETDSTSEVDRNSDSDEDCQSVNSLDSWTPRTDRRHNR